MKLTLTTNDGEVLEQFDIFIDGTDEFYQEAFLKIPDDSWIYDMHELNGMILKYHRQGRV